MQTDDDTTPDEWEKLNDASADFFETKESRDKSKKYDHERVPYDRLRRWLKSHIGKNFNTVYSDFHKLTWVSDQDKNREFLNRVFLHEVTTFNGVLVHTGFRYNMHTPLKESYFNCLYVHPVTNILCFQKGKNHLSYAQQQELKIKDTHRILEDYRQLVKIKGIWYDVTLVESHRDFVRLDSETGKGIYKTVVHKPRSPYGESNECSYYNPQKLKTKRQLSSKELAHYKLKND